MAEPEIIHVEPDTEIRELLRLVRDQTIRIESEGRTFRIEREKRDPFEDYDPAKVLASLRKGIGMFKGLDLEEFNREIKEQREQDSIGRPAE